MRSKEKKQRFADHVIWITGATSGIGKALAIELGRQGAKLALSGRRLERLEELVIQLADEGIEGFSCPCDVTDEAQIRAAAHEIVKRFGGIDVAVANAGFAVRGRIEDLGAEDWHAQLNTNVIGAALTARYAIPHLRRSRGRMVLVGSVAGLVAAPGSGAYVASKHALRAIGQTLAMELKRSGATCTTIHPGFVESEIGRVNNRGEFRPEWTDQRPKMLMWKTEDAARVMADAIYGREREMVFTTHGKVLGFFGRHMPGLLHHLAPGSKRRRESPTATEHSG